MNSSPTRLHVIIEEIWVRFAKWRLSRRFNLLAALVPWLTLRQAHTGAATVFVDELDARASRAHVRMVEMLAAVSEVRAYSATSTRRIVSQAQAEAFGQII